MIKEIDVKDLPRELLLEADPSEKMLDTYINRSKAFAIKTDQVIALVLLLETRPATLEVMNIAVHAQHRNKGYGKALLEYATQYAKENKFEKLDIGTGNSSIHQLALYQKQGFRIIGVETDYFVKHYDIPLFENKIQCRDMVRLQKKL